MVAAEVCNCPFSGLLTEFY
ncbi:hypothetical protein Goklo_022752 [Gossypium klotzschianum]|uniref:Uncharacterized protein n=1 Tax=Gossypium klotzschianum TaxID=34286 RepID=A0A7J8TNL6_9ROSI|nr:hypothetical protein [Gossypium klotzschianum]